MCLFVFTEIPEALTFTPFSLSLEHCEDVEVVEVVRDARFLCFVDSIGDNLCSVDYARNDSNE